MVWAVPFSAQSVTLNCQGRTNVCAPFDQMAGQSVEASRPPVPCDCNEETTTPGACPSDFVEKALDDKRGWTGSPYKSCFESQVRPLIPSQQTATAMDLEEYLQRKMGLQLQGPMSYLTSPSCLPRDSLSVDQQKAVVAGYYGNMARIRNEELRLIEQVQEINSLIGDAKKTCMVCPVRESSDVSLSECADPRFAITRTYCSKRCPYSFTELKQKTEKALLEIGELRQKLREVRAAEKESSGVSQTNLSHSAKDLESAIKVIESQNPMISAITKSNPWQRLKGERKDQVLDLDKLLTRELSKNREVLLKELKTLRAASLCLHTGKAEDCEKFDEVLPKLPAIDLSEFADSSQSLEARSHFISYGCLEPERALVARQDQSLQDGTELVLTSMVTGILGRVARGTAFSNANSALLRGKRGKKLAEAVGKMGRSKTSIRVARAALLGIDVETSATSLLPAISQCDGILRSYSGGKFKSSVKPPSYPQCSLDSSPEVVLENEYRECVQKGVFDLAMASIPLVAGRVSRKGVQDKQRQVFQVLGKQAKLARRKARRRHYQNRRNSKIRRRPLPADFSTETKHDLDGPVGKVMAQEPVHSLEDGVYIYVVDKKKGPIFSHRTPRDEIPNLEEIKSQLLKGEDPTGKYLATHRGLLRRSEQLGGGDILAAGEFQVTNGRVSKISNRSGTFIGDAEKGAVNDRRRLAFAENNLKKYGLPIEKNTVREDFSLKKTREGGNDGYLVHNEADVEAKIWIMTYGTDEFKKVKEFSTRLSQDYPSKIPGQYDMDKVTSKVRARRNKLMEEDGDEDTITELDIALNFLKELQGEGLGVATKKYGPMVDDLVNVIQTSFTR